MRSIYLFFVMCFVSDLQAQVQVRPLPSDGYDQRIRTFINDMIISSTHEHFFEYSNVKRKDKAWTLSLLLRHYSADDIRSAGLSANIFAELAQDSLSTMEKWKIVKPYWERSSNTAYNRAALLAADKLFGIDDINESTVDLLSNKITEAYKTDWMNHVINDKCQIEYLIQDSDDRSIGTSRFRYVLRLDNFIYINSKNQIISIAREQNTSINTIDDFVKALEITFINAKKIGIVGIKTAISYDRILYFEDASRETATRIFEELMKSDEPFPFERIKPFQDYMMHRVLNIAKENNLPVAVHTGLHIGKGNIIENSKPTHLVNLFFKYPSVPFILFHGGYPYGGELATIAKNFRNVYIDMCWLYVISPSYSERYLHEWLETVPASKIMGFGGDYINVENAYAHLQFGKQVIANVLIDKVRDGYMSETEAKKIAQSILHDNAVRIYNLSGEF